METFPKHFLPHLPKQLVVVFSTVLQRLPSVVQCHRMDLALQPESYLFLVWTREYALCPYAKYSTSIWFLGMLGVLGLEQWHHMPYCNWPWDILYICQDVSVPPR